VIETLATKLSKKKQAELVATLNAIAEQYTHLAPGSRRFLVPRSWASANTEETPT
jgi:hypothetical protein